MLITYISMVKFISEWYLITRETLFDLWAGFLRIVPKFLFSLIVFSLGWFLANTIGRLVSGALKKAKLNELFNRGKWDDAFRRAGIKVDVCDFIGAIVKWVLVCVALLLTVQILGLLQFAAFLNRALAFVPDVFASVFIFVVAVILSDICEKLVMASIEKAGLGYSRAAGLLVRSAIMAFAFLAILTQLGIAKSLVLTLFTGLVGALAFSFGLAFGLGGKDIASEILRDLKEKLK